MGFAALMAIFQKGEATPEPVIPRNDDAEVIPKNLLDGVLGCN